MKYRRFRLGGYAASIGFILMVFELAAARLLAPTIGSSMYVWTSVIGIIVLALSFGYWYGGRIADIRHTPHDLAVIFLAVAGCIGIALFIEKGILGSLADSDMDARLKAVIASLTLFAPMSFFCGMASPYLAKLNVRSLESSGRAVADLGALNSIGGIVGTFLAGFVLFGYVGIREVVTVLALLALALSWTIEPRWRRALRIVGSILVGIFLLPSPVARGVTEIDTPSGHYQVITGAYGNADEVHLVSGPRASQSGIARNRPGELIFWYTQQMADIVAKKATEGPRSVKNILILGGGAYTLPGYLATHYPESHIDVVEIDPELIQIARDHFAYQDSPHVTSYPTDARTFVNTAKQRYDVVLVDVFGNDEIPFTFVTRQYGAALRNIVMPDGVVAVNIVANTQGGCRELFDVVTAPYREQFAAASYRRREEGTGTTNILAVFGSEGWQSPSGYRSFDQQAREIFDDNFAPTERLAQRCRLQ